MLSLLLFIKDNEVKKKTFKLVTEVTNSPGNP